MDAIRKIEAALAALPANADSPWLNLDKLPYIHKTDDPKASPWSCAVVGRFDYLPTMDYMLACQPSAIREVLQTLASKEAELAAREAEIAGLRVVVQQMVDVLGEDHGDADDFESECPSCQLVLAGRAALTKQPPTE